MTSEEDWQEVEQLQREAEDLKSYLERPDVSRNGRLRYESDITR